MNYRRWLIVGYMLLLMALSVSILLIPGQKYDTLTTSDSGWVYDTAVEIDKTNALAENNPLSHAPSGLPIPLSEQAQPLFTVMLYRGLSAVNPSVTLMDVVKYWGPLLFALSLIPIFLTGKELGGDLAGCTAVFFAATLISSIYWNKVGAYDREPIQLLLGVWTMYITIKLFKAPRSEMPKFSLLAGLVYGLFGLAWVGWHYTIAILIFGLLFVLLAAFLGRLLQKKSDLFGAIFSAFRGHLDLLLGIVGMMAIVTIVMWTLGGQGPEFWVSAFQTYVGYIGLGGGGAGVAFTTYAGEMQPPRTWGDTIGGFYGSNELTMFILILIILAFLKFCWSRKRWEFLTFAWLIVIAAMVWPLKGQARFERLWWAFVPVMAGVGVAMLVSIVRRFSFEPSGEWLKHLQNPLVLLLVAGIVATPFVANAYVHANNTTPPTEWRGFRGLDDGFMEAFDWARENTPENSVFSIQWSYGHLFTGTARRATVCDGAEVKVEDGKWENDLSFVPRPPDYIYYIEGNQGLIYGIDAPVKSSRVSLEQIFQLWYAISRSAAYVPVSQFNINGRRIDVQRFSIADENEFEWYLTQYRDNYNCKIDYSIFSIDEYWEARNYYYSDLPIYILWTAERIKIPSQLQPSVEDQNRVFNFGENREAVVLDTQTRNVYLRTDGGNLNMDGYGVLILNDQGRVSSYGGFSPPQATADIRETLLLFLDSSNNVVSAWLIKGVSAEIVGRPIPVGLLVFEGYTAVIDYLQLAFTSSNGYVTVVKINHVPVLIFPANGARTHDNTPEFIWSGAVGAVKYKLQVDDNPDFSSSEIQVDNFENKSYTAPAPLAAGTYSWRVGAYNGENEFLGWSDVFTFTIDVQPPSQPQPVLPQDGAELTSLTPTFEWTEPEPDVTYALQIDNEDNFPSPDEIPNITDNSYTTYTFPRNGTYYWRVKAFDIAGNESEWSDNFTLTVRAPPQAPTLVSPENGAAENDNTPFFEWDGGIADNFRLLVDNDSDFGSTALDITLGITSSYTVATENALLDDNYCWKVVAVVGENENSSPVWTFTIDIVRPQAPTLWAPTDGNDNVSDNTPTFEWFLSPDADNYHLVVDNDSELGSPEINVWTAENTYTPTTELPPENYYWQVIAVDAARNENGSSVWVFTIPPLGA